MKRVKKEVKPKIEEKEETKLKEPKPKEIKTLKEEVKNLDSMNSLMLQYAYAVKLLDDSISGQVGESEEQIYDRGKQLIDLKKQVSNLQLESQSRGKNKLLDDILSLEYSHLKPVEEDIVVSFGFLEELQSNCSEYLNRVNLDKGVIISPKDLEKTVEKTAVELNSFNQIIEDEAHDLEHLAADFLELVEVVKGQHELLEEIKRMKQEIELKKLKDNISVIKDSLKNREKYIKKLITENL